MTKQPFHFRRVGFSLLTFILVLILMVLLLLLFTSLPSTEAFFVLALLILITAALATYCSLGTVKITEEALIVRNPSALVVPWWKRTIPWKDILEIKMTLKGGGGFAHVVELAVLILYKDQRGKKQKLWFRPGVVDNWRNLPQAISLICQKATQAKIEPTVYEFCQTGHVKSLKKQERTGKILGLLMLIILMIIAAVIILR